MAAFLFDPALFLQIAEHPVQVVRFDLHRLGDVGGADPRLTGDQIDRLVGGDGRGVGHRHRRAGVPLRGGEPLEFLR